MGWDDLEPGQDDLVQEDKARRKLAKKVKTAKLTKPGLAAEEELYTDHFAGDPNAMTPPAEATLGARKAAIGGPVEPGIFQRVRTGWASFAEVRSHARDERRMRKHRR